MPERSEGEQAQWERANQAWELWVLDPAGPELLRALRRVLRSKRSELSALAASLPGCVRRGAQRDLAQLESGLRDAGVRCELRRAGT